MKDQKDLPLPQTDLPLPEKEISAGKEAKEISKNKWTLFIIIGLAILFATLIGGYLLAAKNATKLVACTAEAKICPNGISVGRSGPKCEFPKCPVITPVLKLTPSPIPTPIPKELVNKIIKDLTSGSHFTNWPASVFRIFMVIGNYAQGGVSGDFAGEVFYAANINGTWTWIGGGNGSIPLCSYFKNYDNFPKGIEWCTCTPRPACLDSKPRCMIAETADMCPPTITPTQ